MVNGMVIVNKARIMNSKQFETYLSQINLQGSLEANKATLFDIYRAHVVRFPYQNLDLYLGKPMQSLSIENLLKIMPNRGGYCFHHFELMFAALRFLEFHVKGVAAWILMGKEFSIGMPQTHKFILVKIGSDLYICDPGMDAATPRWPLKFNFEANEEITIGEGEEYKLEVEYDHYQLFWKGKKSWYGLYRFERDHLTKMPKTSHSSTTFDLCKQIHDSPKHIPVRDDFVIISIQTLDSILCEYSSWICRF